MYVLIDLIGGILPLLILIGIPVLRGLNNSSKQKKEFEEKRRKATYNPSTREKTNVSSWKSIMMEIEKDLNKDKQKKEKKKAKVSPSSMEASRYNKTPQVSKSQVEFNQYQEEILYNDIEDNTMNGEELTNNMKDPVSVTPISKDVIGDAQDELIFSSDPIVQGMIFSEIFAPPKSRR